MPFLNHKLLILILFFFISITPASARSFGPLSLPKLFKAPEIVGLSNWTNSANIKSMSELRGKVVLIDFWTYSCHNCVNTITHIKSWYKKYNQEGFIVLGIHTPEFKFEHDINNVRKAIKKHNILFPVALDNKFRFWNAYHNRYWPAFYLIDKNGVVRYTHFGEGRYKETEAAIVSLLKQNI